MSKSYYDVLGIKKSASDKEVKSAYRKMAKEWHPDKHQGDQKAETKFKEITEAYDVLKDSSKRAAYDQYGHDSFKQHQSTGGGAGGGFSGNPFGGGGEGFPNEFSDIFETFFGGGGGAGRSHSRSSQQSQGSDLRYDITIALHDAFTGKSFPIKCTTNVKCDGCSGSGSKSSKSRTSCNTCKGQGRVRITQGFFMVEKDCDRCEGTGQVISDPCSKCSGNGCHRKSREIIVNIPAGIEHGTRVRLSGEGDAGRWGARAGDMYVYVTIDKHQFFERDNHDLYCRVPVPMTTAVLGGEISVPSIDGKELMTKVRPNSQSKHKLRLVNKGMSILHSSQRGDLYVELEVEMPINLTEKQKRLLTEFQEEEEGKYQSTSKFKNMLNSWLNKMKT